MLIVLALIAITSHFVLGNYHAFLARNHRRVAEIILLQTAAAMEDYAADHLTYIGATLTKLNIQTTDIDNYYSLAIRNIEPDNYLLTATRTVIKLMPIHVVYYYWMLPAENQIQLIPAIAGDKRALCHDYL